VLQCRVPGEKNSRVEPGAEECYTCAMRAVSTSTRLLLAALLAGGCAEAFPINDASVDPRPDADPTLPDADPTLPDADTTLPDADTTQADAIATVDADPNEVIYQSATLGTPGTSGFNVTDKSWLGWRFNVTAQLNTHAVGFHTNGVPSGTAFATIVSLSDASDVPDDPGLTGDDVLITPVVFPVPSSPGDMRVSVHTELQPGWYAVIFGTGAFGASASEPILATRGHVAVAGEQRPFQIYNGGAAIDIYEDERFYVIGILF